MALSYCYSTLREGHLIECQCLDVKVVGLTFWAGVSNLRTDALSAVCWGRVANCVALWQIELFLQLEYQRGPLCCCCANLLVRSAWW